MSDGQSFAAKTAVNRHQVHNVSCRQDRGTEAFSSADLWAKKNSRQGVPLELRKLPGNLPILSAGKNFDPMIEFVQESEDQKFNAGLSHR
jgi:hypothetical protein